MGKLTRDRAMTLGFVGLSFLLAFWQRPGRAMTDTKIDLHVDPVQFLGHVASAWTPTTDLGNVHSAQYSGYLWPMGPFYAVLHSVGVSPWVVQRLWLGLVLALSAWGMLKLFDVWLGRPRGVAHLVAAGFYLLNPYTTVFTAPLELGPHRVRGASLAADRRAPRRAGGPGLARLGGLVVGGRVRAHPRLERRRDQCGRGGLDALRAVGPAALRACPRGGALAGLRRLPVPGRRSRDPGVALVDRPAAGARPLRHRLPAVHRAAALDLVHEQRDRGAPAHGVLDLLPRLRVPRGHPAAVQRLADAALQPAGGRCLAAHPRARAYGTALDEALPLRALPAAAGRGGSGDRGGRVPGGHADPQRHGVGLQALLRPALHAHHPEGGPADRDGGCGPARAGGAAGLGARCASCMPDGAGRRPWWAPPWPSRP